MQVAPTLACTSCLKKWPRYINFLRPSYGELSHNINSTDTVSNKSLGSKKAH